MTSKPLETLRFGATTVEVWPDCVRTILPDGSVVMGAPEDTDDYRARTRWLGYGGDTMTMMRDHEILHAAVPHWLGLPVSPVMSTVAGKPLHDMGMHALEEAAVLHIQRWARHLGVNTLRLKAAKE